MACIALRPAPDSPLPLVRPRPMTRCECSGVAFDEVARQLFAEGRPLDQVLRRTGCGQTCGACLPDLAVHLAAALRAASAAGEAAREAGTSG
jgi:bacterioferritin-associated ferredoxin